MLNYYAWLGPLLRCLPPEQAHNMAITALKHRLLPSQRQPESTELAQNIWSLHFPNPVGIAPGFDKNAVAVDGLLSQGFGFVEVGTITPRPQPGNPQPRMFRLMEDQAIINRLGFNNEGADAAVTRLRKRTPGGIVGVNIGKNKDSADAIEDYVTVLNAVHAMASYITVNISSPNTEGLRLLQEREALDALLVALQAARANLERSSTRRVPLLLKIAPDLSPEQLADIADIVKKRHIDGVIISNTTLSRPDLLHSKEQTQQGGLSGRPLFALSTKILGEFYRLTEGTIPLIGVGGISNGEDAYQKILHGASLVQLYSALIYKGFNLVAEINNTIINRLREDRFSSIAEAIGAAVK